MSNQSNTTNSGIPSYDSMWVVFVPMSFPPMCLWFNSKEEADKFYNNSTNLNMINPIKYTRDF